MTSPSAAHTGIAMTNAEAERHAMADQLADAGLLPTRVRPRPTVDYGTNAAPSHQAMVALAEVSAQMLVDAGHASWCPTCAGTGQGRATITPTVIGTSTTCTRCQGGRLDPFHGCTFQADPPCTCAQRCQVYRPQETPTP